VSPDELVLRVAHLYPTLMNLYGDRGNILAMRRRCERRGIRLEVQEVGIGDSWDPAGTDLLFIGGGQDREQRRILEDLQLRGEALRNYRDADGVILAVCGGFQLFGHSYRGIDGEVMEGAGVFDMRSVHPGPTFERCVGNVVALWEGETLVGFENHGGRTYLNEGAQPLGDVVSGFGNNGGDGSEGCRVRNAFGTYLHGSLLPKNPRLADRLIQLALERRYGDGELAPLDDAWESRAHAEALHVGLQDR
jgi:CobQ-like glutamine amidotransferase family enzyme